MRANIKEAIFVVDRIRYIEEVYDIADYCTERITVCASRDSRGDFEGRVTDYLTDAALDPEAKVFLCGNSRMIDDAMDILDARGIPQGQIFTEVYF
jgi:ferredoxin--NADP+ reductase/benzoate/toluate 1,2-dioxygenase reductase subunit